MLDLLPCPFCGSEAKTLNCGANLYAVQCTKCKAFMGSDMSSFNHPISGVELWSNRINYTIPISAQKKNERGAGRKPKVLPDNLIKDICDEKRAGLSYKAISELRGISVGHIHKLINEHLKTV